MSTLAEIEQAVDCLTPEQVRELSAYLSARLDRQHQGQVFEVLTAADGLPLIRGREGVVTSERVREIEGLAL